MSFFDSFPEISEQFEKMCAIRPSEILEIMLKNDQEYQRLVKERADRSMALKNVLIDAESNLLFENYSDSIYATEIYELGTIYRQAVTDTLRGLKEKRDLCE